MPQETIGPDQIVPELIKLNKTVNSLAASQQNSDKKHDELAETFSKSMKKEETIQRKMIGAINQLSESISTINSEDHMKHHEFMDDFIEAQRAKREFWVGVKSNIATGAIWTTIAALGTVFGYGVREFFHQFKG